jgi:4-diphosphocytidyl-2-C-methyl-D-erythritol kinase
MSVARALAPAKINLGLFVGPQRAADGRHELTSVMQSISLADELTLQDAPDGADGDQVNCPGVAGENLAAAALAAFRKATGWDAPPQLLSVRKRIPVAAGLGGGSADAAATLRLAAAVSGLGDSELLRALAAGLGADVPAQVSPGRWLAGGAGEELRELSAPREAFGVLVLPLEAELSTAAVYAEADRLGLQRTARELARLAQELHAALAHGAPLPAASELLHNDLQRAAVSLCPEIAAVLAEARTAGAELTFVSGSGPTVLGVFADLVAAEHAAAALAGRPAGVFAASPVGASFATA